MIGFHKQKLHESGGSLVKRWGGLIRKGRFKTLEVGIWLLLLRTEVGRDIGLSAQAVQQMSEKTKAVKVLLESLTPSELQSLCSHLTL